MRFRLSDPWSEDKALASRVARGDEEAITHFMDVYFPRLYRFALVRLAHDEMAAEDVVQQTLIVAAKKIGGWRGHASLMTWLTSICARELARHGRRQGKRDKVVTLVEDESLMRSLFDTLEASDAEEPLKYSEKSELAEMVHYVLDNLPNRYGDVLEWKYIQGLSLEEIGGRLDIGSEAVQSMMARARRSFKRAFREIRELGFDIN